MRSISLLLSLFSLLLVTRAFVCNHLPRPFLVRQPTALDMTVLTYNGKKKNFPPGSPLDKAVAQLGVPVKYSCRK